jgi:hypothetical protein
MRLHQKLLVFGLLAATAQNLGACGTAATDERGAEAAGIQVISPAALEPEADDPNDPYNAFLSEDFLAINSAKIELEYKCYAAQGYPQFLSVLPVQKANAFRSLALTPDFKATFASFAELPWFPSEAYARAAGFGHTMAARDAYVFTSDSAFQQTARDCETKALTAMAGSADLIQAYTTLGNTLADAIAAAAKQNKPPLTQKVFACMSKGKYPVDQNGSNKQPIWNVDFGVPYGTPPPQHWPNLTKGGAVQIVPAVPEERYVPTPQEADAAAAMYQCSVDSGAHDLWKKAITDAKEKALVQNEASLSDLSPKIHALSKSAALAVQSQP